MNTTFQMQLQEYAPYKLSYVHVKGTPSYYVLHNLLYVDFIHTLLGYSIDVYIFSESILQNIFPYVDVPNLL